MGLDMYLHSLPRIPGKSLDDVLVVANQVRHREALAPELLEQIKPHIVKGRYSYTIVTEIGYWRKANHIHRWFVENVQNGEDECNPHEVTKEHLEKLLDVCHQALELKGMARKLLPTQNGFFFGNSDYGDWYYDDIRTTINTASHALHDTNFEERHLFYVSSW